MKNIWWDVTRNHFNFRNRHRFGLAPNGWVMVRCQGLYPFLHARRCNICVRKFLAKKTGRNNPLLIWKHLMFYRLTNTYYTYYINRCNIQKRLGILPSTLVSRHDERAAGELIGNDFNNSWIPPTLSFLIWCRLRDVLARSCLNSKLLMISTHRL